MIQLYTGDGKGKTTAAIGQAVRAAGNGYFVIFAQFMKGNDSGELHALKRLDNVRVIRSEKDFGFYRNMSEEQKKQLTDIHNQILDEILQAVKEKKVFLVVLDEVTYAVNWGLLDVEKLRELISFIKSTEAMKGTDGISKEQELVLTGRNAADFLTEAADYITEMQCIRHPYEKGITARIGIEY